jgi:hypothetical protein
MDTCLPNCVSKSNRAGSILIQGSGVDMRLTKIASAKRPELKLSPALRRKLAMALPVVFAALVGLMSAFASVHDRFNWVPISHENIVVDSGLKLALALVLLAVAVLVMTPLALALHVVGHAVAGHFFGMRLLAVRIGPLLVTPWAIGNRFEWLSIKSRMDLLTGWTQFDDSPLPTWKRARGWQVMIGGGSAMNLAVSFLCAIMSVFASDVTYVLLRQAVWLNLLVSIVNIVPFVWARFDFESDGKKLMTLFLDEGDADEQLMERLRNEVIVGPIRPASWPRERETAWETRLRQTPATEQGKAEQLETMIYLFVQGVDRSDSEVAWRWVQAMQNVLANEPRNHDIAFETARVMCALYAARWERNPESATQLIEQISPESGITANPWYTVARAATSFAESTVATFSAEEKLEEARRRAARALNQLIEPARLHGIDQMMRGIAQAILGDAQIELQKRDYLNRESDYAETAELESGLELEGDTEAA